MNERQKKLENPVRIDELKPLDTLKRIGVKEHHVVCDIGAGSGIFTIPASMITKNTVYATEISEEMLEIIKEKTEDLEIKNVELVKVRDDKINIDKKSVDMVLMVTVLHEIKNISTFLKEIEQLLNCQGKITVIEFHKRETPMGPPTEHRMDKAEIEDLLEKIEFTILESFDLGDNFYCLVFKRKELLP